MVSPRSGLPLVTGWLAEMLGPGITGLACGVEQDFSAGLDQLSSLVEGLAHVVGYPSVRGRDESGDQPGCLAGAARAGRAGGGARHPGVQDGGDVVSMFRFTTSLTASGAGSGRDR